MLSTVIELIDEILTTNAIPALPGDDIDALCSHLFALRNFEQRIDIAEVAYANHKDPQALNIFLACTMPIAQRMATRQAYRESPHPSDWQLEAKYDGAVTFLLRLFHSHHPLQSIPDAFRRFLLVSIRHGTMHLVRKKEHYNNIAVEDVTLFSPMDPNSLEQEVITRELLEQVMHFPHLREEESRLLKAIAALGPEKALRDQNYHSEGQWTGTRKGPRIRNDARSKKNRGSRPLLDFDSVASAMGISHVRLKGLLRSTRVILRDAFNRDGNLFTGS